MNAGSILGVYKSGIPRGEQVRIHTPDPTKYHDPANVMLGTTGDFALASLMNRNAGYAGWRATIIPHASELGGSLGHNHHAPAHEVYIDPELNNKAIVVDMAQFQDERVKEALANAAKEARATLADPRDAAVVTWGQFAHPLGSRSEGPVQLTIKQGNEQTTQPLDELRVPPVQMPGQYVVPKALPGGGQMQPANFTRAMPMLPPAPSPVPSTVFQAPPSPPPAPPSPPVQIPLPAVEQIRSLHDAFQEAPVTPAHPAAANRPLRKVIFELPSPLGRFQVHYHDVVKGDGVLVLVYDHRRPMQMVWFPPAIEKPSGEPEALAALVIADGTSPDTLYRVYPTGMSFVHEGVEFSILTVDMEKQIPKGSSL